jgi:hypothetical protein
MWNNGLGPGAAAGCLLLFSFGAWAAPNSARPSGFSRQDSLFLAAATGEPRFQALHDAKYTVIFLEMCIFEYI